MWCAGLVQVDQPLFLALGSSFRNDYLMPEMPEVETIRRGLTRHVLRKKITAVEVRKPKLVRGLGKMLASRVVGKRFTAIDRRGKLLVFHLSSDEYMLVHLKMTGQLIYAKGRTRLAGGHSWPRIMDALPSKYSHVIFSFADGSMLFFNDMRQFGYVEVVNEERLTKILAGYGPEPLDVKMTLEEFSERLSKRAVAIKAALLNQQIVAGIGNIYADEACFYAGIRPGRKVKSLTLAERERLFTSVRQVLKRALRYGGTTFSNFRDVDGKKGNFTRLLKAYGRGGMECLRCGFSPLKRGIVASRGTVWCPNCQR